MKEDMRRIKEEWERRLSEEELEGQRRLIEERAKSALQLQALQQEYTQLMDTKISKIQ